MAQNNVDPNRVIQKLALQLAQTLIQNAAQEVALEDANEVIAKHLPESSADGT